MPGDITDTLINKIENSEVAEILVVTAALAYLGAVELGALPPDATLRMTALAVIAAAVGLDTLVKRFRRRGGK